MSNSHCLSCCDVSVAVCLLLDTGVVGLNFFFYPKMVMYANGHNEAYTHTRKRFLPVPAAVLGSYSRPRQLRNCSARFYTDRCPEFHLDLVGCMPLCTADVWKVIVTDITKTSNVEPILQSVCEVQSTTVFII